MARNIHQTRQAPVIGDGVVDDDLVAVAQPELAHTRREFLRRGQHVRQRVRRVGDLVDVEEDRAGDVLVDELRLGIALLRRQEERAVDDAHSPARRDGPPATRC
jgi:hypothetical protein